MHRRFAFLRDEDETGISGRGLVVEGVQYSDGHCDYRWMTEHQTSQSAANLDIIIAIHGHNGRTRVVFIDRPDGTVDEWAFREVAAAAEASRYRWAKT
jgi:hypothetical protein